MEKQQSITGTVTFKPEDRPGGKGLRAFPDFPVGDLDRATRLDLADALYEAMWDLRESAYRADPPRLELCINNFEGWEICPITGHQHYEGRISIRLANSGRAVDPEIARDLAPDVYALWVALSDYGHQTYVYDDVCDSLHELIVSEAVYTYTPETLTAWLKEKFPPERYPIPMDGAPPPWLDEEPLEAPDKE